jgi:hypothetical protein
LVLHAKPHAPLVHVGMALTGAVQSGGEQHWAHAAPQGFCPDGQTQVPPPAGQTSPETEAQSWVVQQLACGMHRPPHGL